MPQVVVFAVLLLALILFVAGRWRYDLVALMALLALAVTRIVAPEQVFAGFSHPAVVTVAAVLVVSRGLTHSGLVDAIANGLSRLGQHAAMQRGALVGLVTFLSAFMNNVGALALLMPVAIRVTRRMQMSPSSFLMPLAFGSLLGGLITLIGTPPNIIIATARAQSGAEPFRMFDFAPVGVGVAVAGALFVVLVGWRLLPERKGQASREELFQVEDYITEVRVPEGSPVAGKFLMDFTAATEVEVLVLGVVRNDRRLTAPSGFEILRQNDILIVQADSEALKTLLNGGGLELVADQKPGEEALRSDDVAVVEAVVMPDSIMDGRTARTLNLRWRFGVNLLAVARQGARLRARLANIRFRAGDVLLLQGRNDVLPEALTMLGCLPLAERGLRLGQPRRILLALLIFGGALAAAALGILRVDVAFVLAAALMVLAGLLSLNEVYESIEWPVIVLLGAMIPVGQALETTGGAQWLAEGLLSVAGQWPPVASLVLVLVGTMFLSDLVNNAAAAVLMAPIAIRVAHGLGVSADPFLMAVALGASCAFLTPVGHQSNTLVMGPGGYRFGDYWRMGLLLEVIIVLVAVPLILAVWPLG